MKRTTILWSLVLVTAMSLLGVAATFAQAGQARLVVMNYVGKEMAFTLDGTQGSVPASDAAQPGKMTFTVAPGKHEFSGAIPGGPGANALVELAAGQTYVLGVRLDKSKPVLAADGAVLEEPRDVLILFEASQNPSAAPAAAMRVPLQTLPAGQGALVFDNYIGEGLVVSLGGAQYRVPADGRQQVNLAPGEYTYSISAGVSGTNGAASVTAGQYSGLGFSRETPPEPTFEVGEAEPTAVVLRILVSSLNLSGEAVVQSPAAPAQPAPPASPQPASTEATLTVTNYASQSLTFTINNTTHQMAENGGQASITLAPGEYTYTASTPRASANNSLALRAGETKRLSVATNLEGSQINLYLE